MKFFEEEIVLTTVSTCTCDDNSCITGDGCVTCDD